MKKITFALFVLFCCVGCSTLSRLAVLGGRVSGGFPGFEFRAESCQGNLSEGKAVLTFVYVHRLAPQSVSLLSGVDTYAADHFGNRYQVSFVGNQSTYNTAAGVPQKVVMEIKGIAPGIEALNMVSCRVKTSTTGVYSDQKLTVLHFRNVPIVWK